MGKRRYRLLGKADFQLCLNSPSGSLGGLRECGGCSEELPEPIHPSPIPSPPSGTACSATSASLLINSPALIVPVLVVLQGRDAEPRALFQLPDLDPGLIPGQELPLLPGTASASPGRAATSGRSRNLRSAHLGAIFWQLRTRTGSAGSGTAGPDWDGDQGEAKGTAGQRPDLDLGTAPGG